MEDQKRPNNLISGIWNNWCNLDPQKRSQVAERLGPVGHMLSIAANVSEFAKHGSSILQNGAPPKSAERSEPSSKERDDEDVIDVEFEETSQ